MTFSDEFWLIDVVAQHLESLRLQIDACASFYAWRNHRSARWERVLRRWEGKHRVAKWRAVDDLGHAETSELDFAAALAYFGSLWAKRLHREGRSASRKVEVTAEGIEQGATFTVDFVADGKAS